MTHDGTVKIGRTDGSLSSNDHCCSAKAASSVTGLQSRPRGSGEEKHSHERTDDEQDQFRILVQSISSFQIEQVASENGRLVDDGDPREPFYCQSRVAGRKVVTQSTYL